MTCRVVIVEDDPDISLIQRLVLEGAACEVVAAVDSVEAAQQLPDDLWAGATAAVVDYMLPGAHGGALCAWLTERYPHVVRVLVSGVPIWNLDPSLADVADRFITKPFTLPELLAAIHYQRDDGEKDGG